MRSCMLPSLRLALGLALLALLALACGPQPAAAHLQVHPLSMRISIDVPVLTGVGNTVTVSWSGMPSTFPGNSDWIGVYSPRPATFQGTTPNKYKSVVPDVNGAGSTQIWLVNMRASYVVAYFTGGLKNGVLLAESEPVEFETYNLPLQIHLALTQNPSEMRVDWNSALKSAPSVRWGSSPDKLDNVVTRVMTDTLEAHEMCGPPAATIGWHESGFLHTALIEGLKPNTQYWYEVGDKWSDSRSEVLTFFSAPVPSPSTDVDFIIFGDLGQTETDGSNMAVYGMMPESIYTTRAMARDFSEGVVALNRSAAVFHIGDISYAMGFGTVWEQFFYQISPMSPFVPWMTIDGNHERDWPDSGSWWTGKDSGGECGVATQHRFHMPIPDSAQPDQIWWSINYGPVHLTVISTEHVVNATSEQFKWIAQDWARVNRSETPFLVLAGHRPMYIDSTYDAPQGGDTSVGDLLIEALEPLMRKYRVDVAFWGHHHSYQRTCPVHAKKCVPQSDGTVHIVTGAAGPDFSRNLHPVAPEWIEVVDITHHGYVRAHVRGNDLTLNFINAQDRSIIDSVSIASKFPVKQQGLQQEEAELVALF